jgi:hypothetical protein
MTIPQKWSGSESRICQKALALGQTDSFGTVTDAEFAEDVRYMDPDRAATDEERVCDLRISPPFGDELQNLEFTGRQAEVRVEVTRIEPRDKCLGAFED